MLCGTVSLPLIQTAAAASAQYEPLYAFQGGSDGGEPNTPLVALGGKLYGTTTIGGSGCGRSGCGTIFSIVAGTGKKKILHAFVGGTDGAMPYAGLVSLGHVLYGTTGAGGNGGCRSTFTVGCGTVFSLDTRSGAEHVLHVFDRNETDGAVPGASLTVSGRTLYGTTQTGGEYDQGTLFSIDADTGAETILYSFKGGAEGAGIYVPLLLVNGVLYGTTDSGGEGCGEAGCGTVFSFDLSTGSKKTLYAFKGGKDGANPRGGLSMVGNALLGVTMLGGGPGTDFCSRTGCGTIFSVNVESGAEQTLYAFKGYPEDGYSPATGLLPSGNTLYGATLNGGATDRGTLFSFDLKSAAEKLLYTFRGGLNGSFPQGSLIFAKGLVYGAAPGRESAHCSGNCGVVFRFDPE